MRVSKVFPGDKQHGGVRVECKVKAPTISDALALVKAMDVIQLLQRFEILDIPPREILNACREGLTLLEFLGLFQGTDVNDTNPSVKQAHRLHQPGRILPSACLQPPGQEGDDGGRHLRAMENHYDFTSPPGSPCTRGSHLVVLE